jgi:hypothetical protein
VDEWHPHGEGAAISLVLDRDLSTLSLDEASGDSQT